jgi:hypothetical protein
MSELANELHKYCEAAQGQKKFSFTDSKKANECYRDLQACYEALRQSHEGRDAITSLLSHDDLAVRLWAAAHSLEWTPGAARELLEQIRDGGGSGSFTAEMTLQQYDEKGRLHFGSPKDGDLDDR